MSKKELLRRVKFAVEEKKLKIFDKNSFNPEHILECGQIFSFEKKQDCYTVYSKDKSAKITEMEDGYEIDAESPEYFVDFFDLKTDYTKIKNKLNKFEILKEPIKFGQGIRILKQDLFETLISFIVSANNNIKRIQLILKRIRSAYGKDMGSYYAFPTREELLRASEEEFKALGAGYRATYLYKVLRQVDEETLHEWQELPTAQLRQKLISLSGVGPKVADCILLFGYARGDVFPVDTWIEKMYFKFYKSERQITREKIRENLTKEFGLLSGYAQQYLFYFMRAE